MAVRPIDILPVIGEIQSSLDIPSYGEHDRGFDDALEFVLDLIEKAPTLTQPNEPLTLEELREMDGEPVWWDDGDWSCWGIVTVDTDGFWAGIPFLRGRRNQNNFEYNIKLNRMKIYRRPPEGEEETP